MTATENPKWNRWFKLLNWILRIQIFSHNQKSARGDWESLEPTYYSEVSLSEGGVNFGEGLVSLLPVFFRKSNVSRKLVPYVLLTLEGKTLQVVDTTRFDSFQVIDLTEDLANLDPLSFSSGVKHIVLLLDSFGSQEVFSEFFTNQMVVSPLNSGLLNDTDATSYATIALAINAWRSGRLLS